MTQPETAVPGQATDERPGTIHAVPLRRPGRPKVEQPKVPVTMRVDADVLEALKASGTGWQTRVNQVLREAVRRGVETRMLSSTVPVQVWAHRPQAALAWLALLDQFHSHGVLDGRLLRWRRREHPR